MDPELSDVDLEDQNSRWTKYLKKDTVVDKKSLHIIECCEDEICPNSKLPKTMPQLIASMKAEKNKKEDSSPPTKKILPHLHPLVTEFRRSLQQKRPASELEGIVEIKETRKKSPADLLRAKEMMEETPIDEQLFKDEDPFKEEDLFYSTYVPKSDDMWQALEDECEEIEKYFKNKSSKSS